MQKPLHLLLVAVLLAVSALSNAQRIHCNMIELPFGQLVSESKKIVHARVLESVSRWDEDGLMIYTYTQLIVKETFKGSAVNEIMLVTEGGRSQGYTWEFQDRFELHEGEEVVLFLEKVPAHWNASPMQGISTWTAYASKQGVFNYNPETGEVKDIFERFKTLETFRQAVAKHTGHRSKTNGHSESVVPSPPDNTAIAVINSISPTIAAAGTGNILTITGSGFGATRGTGFVEFTTATGTFGIPKAKEYISWTDTQIQIFIPATFTNSTEPAATGIVRVTPSGGTAASSAGNLTIRYSLFQKVNATVDSTVTIRMINANSAGGYTFQYNNQFTTLSTQAPAALERAMNTWKCATNVHWAISPTTTTIRATGNDNVNVITDDVQAPLPAGVLGRGSNLVGDCISGGIVRAVTVQMDVIVADIPGSFTWFFGTGTPGSTQVDFETVFLHEFGHLHQMNHTKTGGLEVMVTSISAGTTRRALTQNDLDGAADAMARSTAATACGTTPHIPLNGSITISTPTSFPVCNPSSITFNATTTNLTSNTTLEWLRNGAVAGTGNSFVLTNPLNNDVVQCRIVNCSAIVSNSITVLTNINSASISYNSPFCKSLTSAQNVVLTGTSGGTFSASPAGLTLNTSSGAITPSSSTAGSYTVTYTTPASGVCPVFNTTTSVSITAVPNAAFSYSPTSMCKSITTAINPTITGSPGGTFSASPAGLSINASTGAITPSLSTGGSYTVTRTIAASGGCSAVASTFSVTILNQLATPGVISGAPANACGVTRTYSIAAVSGASSYQWTVPAGVTGSSTTTSITLTFPNNFTSGVLKVRALASNGCHSNERTLNLTGPPATPGVINVTNINTVLYTATANISSVAGATSYNWTGNGVTILSGQGTTTVSVVATANPATLCVRAINACGQSPSSCKTVSFFAGNSGAQMAEFEELPEENKSIPVIFPNPAEDEISLYLDESWETKLVWMEIIDMEGRLVESIQYNTAVAGLHTMDVSALSTGIYILQLSMEGRTERLKLIKE